MSERAFIINEISRLPNGKRNIWDSLKLLDRIAAQDQPLELLAPLLVAMQDAPNIPTKLLIELLEKLLKYGFLDAAGELVWSKEDVAPLEVKVWWSKAIELEIDLRAGRETGMSWNIYDEMPDDISHFWRSANRMLACEEISPRVRERVFRGTFDIYMPHQLERFPAAATHESVVKLIVIGVNLNIKYGLGNERSFLWQFSSGLSVGGIPARNAIAYMHDALTSTTEGILEKTGYLLRSEAWKWYREHGDETLKWLQKSCTKERTLMTAIGEEASKQSKCLGVAETDIRALFRPPPMPARSVLGLGAAGLALILGVLPIYGLWRGPDAGLIGTLILAGQTIILVIVFAPVGWLVGAFIDLIRDSKNWQIGKKQIPLAVGVGAVALSALIIFFGSEVANKIVAYNDEEPVPQVKSAIDPVAKKSVHDGNDSPIRAHLSPEWLGTWKQQDGNMTITISAVELALDEVRNVDGEVNRFQYEHSWLERVTAKVEEGRFGYSGKRVAPSDIAVLLESAIARFRQDPADFGIGDPAASRRAIASMSPGMHAVVWSYGGGEWYQEYIVDGDRMLQWTDDPHYGFGADLFNRVR